MSDPDRTTSTLERAFRAAESVRTVAPGCPDADTLRAAATLSAPPAVRRGVLGHVAVCPACTVAWEAVREIAATAPAGTAASRTGRRPGPALAVLAAAAALAIAFVLVSRTAPDRAVPAEWRTSGSLIEWNLVPPVTRLDPDRPALAWPDGPDGTRYRVRLWTPALEPLADVGGLERARLDVPSGVLAGLEPDAIALWQVEATLPDGRRVTSPTFRATLAARAP